MLIPALVPVLVPVLVPALIPALIPALLFVPVARGATPFDPWVDQEAAARLERDLVEVGSRVSVQIQPLVAAADPVLTATLRREVTRRLQGRTAPADEARLRREVVEFEGFRLQTYVTSGVAPKAWFGFVDGVHDTADLEADVLASAHVGVEVANAWLAAHDRAIRVTDAEVLTTWIAEGGALLLGPLQQTARRTSPGLDAGSAVGLDDLAAGLAALPSLGTALDRALGTSLATVQTGQALRPVSLRETVAATVIMWVWEKDLCERKLRAASRASLAGRPAAEQLVLASLVYNSGILFSEERVQQVLAWDTGVYLHQVSEENAADRWRLPVLPPAASLERVVRGGYPAQGTDWSAVVHVLQRLGGYEGLRRFADVFDAAGALRGPPPLPPGATPPAPPAVEPQPSPERRDGRCSTTSSPALALVAAVGALLGLRRARRPG